MRPQASPRHHRTTLLARMTMLVAAWLVTCSSMVGSGAWHAEASTLLEAPSIALAEGVDRVAPDQPTEEVAMVAEGVEESEEVVDGDEPPTGGSVLGADLLLAVLAPLDLVEHERHGIVEVLLPRTRRHVTPGARGPPLA